jgi:hypothetical protein
LVSTIFSTCGRYRLSLRKNTTAICDIDLL